MDRFLDLLNSVKKKSNSTFHSCEPELIELMRQIDEMIELKNKEWKSDIELLESQLDAVHNENVVLVKEVKFLKTALADETKSHSVTLNQYEMDVKHLKDDMSKLKRKYLDLQKKIENTKRKRLHELNMPSGKALKETIRAKPSSPEDLQSDFETENFVLKLKLESLTLENENLRMMFHNHSLPVSNKNCHYNNTNNNDPLLGDATLDDGIPHDATATSSFYLTLPTNKYSEYLSKPRSTQRITHELSNNPDNATTINHPPNHLDYNHGSVNSARRSYGSSRKSGVPSKLEYFDVDMSLEDKLNSVISEFELVSSNFKASSV